LQNFFCRAEGMGPPPVAGVMSRKISKPKARWIGPEVLKDVEYRALTGDVDVCHPFFKGPRGIWG